MFTNGPGAVKITDLLSGRHATIRLPAQRFHSLEALGVLGWPRSPAVGTCSINYLVSSDDLGSVVRTMDTNTA
jgi:hypothetical protein